MRIRWKTIARVVKTHAKSGEVVVASVHGLPPLLRSGMTVAVVPPRLKSDRYLEVAEASSGGSSQLVSFSGVTTIGEAQELVGRFVLANMADLPDDIDLLDKDSLVGRRVVDTAHGFLGTCTSVMSGPSQDVLVLEGERGELLVPVLPEFIVDADASTITLSLPQGALASAEA